MLFLLKQNWEKKTFRRKLLFLSKYNKLFEFFIASWQEVFPDSFDLQILKIKFITVITY